MDITVIGKQIAALRKEKGIKQEELANYVGVTAQAVSKWENGGVPDTELIPRIADYFEVSIDSLFGRSAIDESRVGMALIKKIVETRPEERFRLAFDLCWDMERALFGDIPSDGNIAEYEASIEKNSQRYSSILCDQGFTRMGIANRLQYFLLVPEPKDTEKAFFEGVDYTEFFRDFSDQEIFHACVMLHRRDCKKSFTPGLLVKRMDVTFDRALEIIKTLAKYNLIVTTQIEMDDVTQEVYKFNPTASFVALLIFAREMIKTPNVFSYFSGGRFKPYLN